jgi:hypothetical protein
MIGFNDVIDNRFHSTSVKCLSSHGVIFAIKAEEFLHKMQRDPAMWRNVKKLAKEKDSDLDNQIWSASYNLSKFQNQ